jgi:ribosomal protein L40E
MVHAAAEFYATHGAQARECIRCMHDALRAQSKKRDALAKLPR